jgi:hypothetical protein
MLPLSPHVWACVLHRVWLIGASSSQCWSVQPERAANRLAQVVARVVCMRWCPVGVHVCAAGLAFPCQTCLLNAGLCHRCMHVHICVQVSLGPVVVRVAYLVHSSWVPAVPCSSCGWGWFCHTRVCSWSCVPLLCVSVCEWGKTHLCCAHWALPARVACGYICVGVALVCAMCSALPDARICTLVANVCVVAGTTI